MSTETLLCRQANRIDLVDYLEKLGYHSRKIRNNDYWYLSPFRDEKTPSFKVNRELNIWYDHGIGKGGNLVDFGILYFNCSVSELLHRLRDNQTENFSFHPPLAVEKKEPAEGRILILEERSLVSVTLLQYLEDRHIPAAVAKNYCREVDFSLYEKKYSVIGFKNNAGGFELRSRNFKGSSSPKGITLISNEATENLLVFEGFFDFLSFQTQKLEASKTSELSKLHGSFLILNSLAFFEKSCDLMEKHESVHLFLDRDEGGLKRTAEALSRSEKYKDESIRYKGFKDLNECLVKSGEEEQRQSHGRRLRL